MEAFPQTGGNLFREYATPSLFDKSAPLGGAGIATGND